MRHARSSVVVNSRSIRSRSGWIAVAVLAGAAAAAVPHFGEWTALPVNPSFTTAPAVGMPGGASTSAEGLRQRIDEMEKRLANQPSDAGAAVLLADALLRQARATNRSGPTARATGVLLQALKGNPGQYDVLRMLGAIHLSQHRFREAAEVARQARELRPGDAWNYGVLGDASIELGDYDQAIAAFEAMMNLRPNAAAYARVAYARELRGDLDGALSAMQMASKATPGHDPEAQAWYTTQIGELHLKRGALDAADRAFRQAAFFFPNHPAATLGGAKVKLARGDADGALAIYLDELGRTRTVDLAARIGDLYAARRDRDAAERYYRLAEDLAGPDAAQTEAALALFLAEHDRDIPRAVRIAEAVAAVRHDIFTEDALAWAYYKAGRIAEAFDASRRALRTGTRDERIVSHAAQIASARLSARRR
jgi:tetratricopeptide (TPR) repeat protein